APPGARESFEGEGVDLVPVHLERVALAVGADRLGGDGSTEPRDVRAERLLGGPWRLLAPELVDERVDRDDVSRSRQEAGEDRALLRAGDRNGSPVVADHLERPEHEEPHGPARLMRPDRTSQRVVAPRPHPRARRGDAPGDGASPGASVEGDRGDLNPQPPGPQPGALTGLSYGHHLQPDDSIARVHASLDVESSSTVASAVCRLVTPGDAYSWGRCDSDRATVRSRRL